MKGIKNNALWKFKEDLVIRIYEKGLISISKNTGKFRSENTMGDRVLFQVFKSPVSVGESGNSEFGPVIYGHWCGSEATDVCKRLKRRMNSRPNDVEYTSARLVQILVGDESKDANENTGFGIWNADALLKKEDSHGGAGIVLVDVSEREMKFLCFGGYLKVGSDGFPYNDNFKQKETEENDKQSKQA